MSKLFNRQGLIYKYKASVPTSKLGPRINKVYRAQVKTSGRMLFLLRAA